MRFSERQTKIYVLDTNVLMHDPLALFRFDEHDLFIPIVVIEELDAHKTGLSESARNARQASRFLSDIILGSGQAMNGHGCVPIAQAGERNGLGHLYFETDYSFFSRSTSNSADNTILDQANQIKGEVQGARDVIVVSKDTNLRIKAAMRGLRSEDYRNDQALSDLDLLYSGFQRTSKAAWNELGVEDAQYGNGRVRYALDPTKAGPLLPNQGFFIGDDDAPDAMISGIIRMDSDTPELELVDDYTGKSSAWGIKARNPEQNLALNLLMDPSIDFVTLVGGAGTGKTLLALAAGLTQVFDDKRFHEIIVTRATVPVGQDIGFLPGTEEEKLTPWLGALTDNLEVLLDLQGKDSREIDSANLFVNSRISVRSISFMRGRTFLNRYLIVDEAQNLTSKEMKTLITRAGPGTKIVCLGNLEQIDTPYLTEMSSGLTYVVDRFKAWRHSGHVTLQRGERSRLADFAQSVL